MAITGNGKPARPPSTASASDPPPEIDKGGRPAHEPTIESRKVVETLSGAGVAKPVIATHVGISENTLNRHYPHELTKGKANVHAMIGQTLVRMAVGAPAQYDEKGNKLRDEVLPNTQVLIFLGKCRLGLKETNVSEFVDRTDDADYNTAGLDESERASRVVALFDRARARRVGRAVNGKAGVGTDRRPTKNGVRE